MARDGKSPDNEHAGIPTAPAVSLSPDRKPTKSHKFGCELLKKMKYEGRSGDMYENKGLHDNMSAGSTDISTQLMLVLQKITDFERNLS